MKSLYAYFGLLDLHSIDSPGHSLYQIGLIDAIREEFNEEKFDFYSYYPEHTLATIALDEVKYPDTARGRLLSQYRANLIDLYALPTETMLKNITEKKYNKLYLKARFRNLSTLAKKWKDAAVFEEIINTALASGYKKDEIIILDTDLSLSESFYQGYSDKVTVLIPSIDFPGISEKFLQDCVEVNTAEITDMPFEIMEKNIVYYGNIDTSTYKAGNSKSPDLLPILEWLQGRCANTGKKFIAICKEKDRAHLQVGSEFVARNDRRQIWKTLATSVVMLNVTKEKYDSEKFIPARIYEAMIFGMVPVSYKFDWLSSAFSFNNELDLNEILKYLDECSPSDLRAAYLHFIKDYLKHEKQRKNGSPRPA